MSKLQRMLIAGLGVFVIVIFVLVMVAQQTKDYGTEVTVEQGEFQQLLFLVESRSGVLSGAAVSFFYPGDEPQGFTFFPANYQANQSTLGQIYSENGVVGLSALFTNLLQDDLDGVVVIPQANMKSLVEKTLPSITLTRNTSVVVGGKSLNLGKGVYTPTVEEGVAILSSKDTVGDVAELRKKYAIAIYGALGEKSKSPDKEINRILTKDLTLHGITPDNMMWVMSTFNPHNVTLYSSFDSGKVWSQRITQVIAGYKGELVSFGGYDFSVPVEVLNGSGWPSLASKTGRYLENSGFAVGYVGNALTPNGNVNYSHKTTDIAYYGGEEVRQTALVLGALIHSTDIQPSTELTEPKIVLTLGADFNDQYYVNTSN